MMKSCSFDSVLNKYKVFRDEHYDVILELNKIKKDIRFIKQFGEYADIQVIRALYQKEDDISDIAELLGITECEVYFLLNEEGRKGVIENEGDNI